MSDKKTHYFNGKTFDIITEKTGDIESGLTVTLDEFKSFRAEVKSGKKIIIKDGKLEAVDNNGNVKPLETWDDIRAQRNARLAGSDFTQVADYPEKKKAAYAKYRQELRDITKAFKEPSEVKFPKEPS